MRENSRQAGRPLANSLEYYRISQISTREPFGELTGAIEVKFWTILVTVFVTGTILENLQEQERSILGHFRSRLVFHFKTSSRVFF